MVRRALRSEGEEMETGRGESKVAAVILFSDRLGIISSDRQRERKKRAYTVVSQRPSLVASRAPSLNRYALTLKSPAGAADASWTTKTARPRFVTLSIDVKRSIAARVAKPPLCVER